MKAKSIGAGVAVAAAVVLGGWVSAQQGQSPVGNVIFIHPDGQGPNGWAVARLAIVGPDGELNWDKLPHIAAYKGHMLDSVTASSNGGAITHAYGVKVPRNNAGMLDGKPVVAANGQPRSLLLEAKRRGLSAGIVNSASITDAGTGLFVAQVPNRRDHTEIARQIFDARPEVVLGGGEQWFLPRGVRGRHGEGQRPDGRNLIDEFRRAGYTVVYTRDELLRLPRNTIRLLGLFAADDTFNDLGEEELKERGLEPYPAQAPTTAEMTEAALRVLENTGRRFLLVAEEEGSDNFAGENNASGTIEALRRADGMIGHALAFLRRNPNTLILTTADSDCGGMQAKGLPIADAEKPLGPRSENGAPMDGRAGTGSPPFLAEADRNGRRWPFAVVWADSSDLSGGNLIRASGLNASLVRGTADNTFVYEIMYRTLFGRSPR
ncbi:MAG: alkaline phosphatase [Fimbriimonadaceae bacterium]